MEYLTTRLVKKVMIMTLLLMDGDSKMELNFGEFEIHGELTGE
jgi:hypothetical protein